MASTEGAVEDEASASTQGNDAPNLPKASLKRKTNKTQNQKAKKKKTGVKRTAQPRFTVHEGEDMLLVISSSTSQNDGPVWAHKKKKKGGKKKNATIKGNGGKRTTGKKKNTKPIIIRTVEKKEEVMPPMFVAEKPNDHRWGQSLPEEVLVNIFKMVVMQDGAVPFLCRVGRVCRLWNSAAATPVLWRKVSVGHCWIKDIFFIIFLRFSQLRDFSLHHWTKNVDHVVSQFCPRLSALTLSYCTGLTELAFQSLGLHSCSLQSLNLQYTEVMEGLLTFFSSAIEKEKKKSFILRFCFQRGCCPDLELLEVNTKLDSKDGELPLCVQALQMACPKLKTFRMLNVRPLQKNMRNGAELALGFPLLEELCIATTSYSYMTDKYLWDVLFGSPRLRVLDLRGCSRITSEGLAALPCLELECLFWGQYFSSHVGTSSLRKGLHAVTQKWGQTLRQLDVANQPFSEEDLEVAMRHLAQANDADTLRSLNLSGTRITTAALRSVIGQTTALDYLNLSSCRYLPRGLKRIYRGQEDIPSFAIRCQPLSEPQPLLQRASCS
uniref:F-box and leucine rich repeat protein 6 n=1 Tax=Hippocampus comes TaxID=109280 RepID=A0A3Q2XU84_HIPCM